MKKIKFIQSLVFAFTMAIALAIPIASFAGGSPLLIGGAIAAAPFAKKLTARAYFGFIPRQVEGYAFMAVQKENWVDYILGNLFKDNEFLKYCFDESDNVLNGTVVHIPQAGAKPVVRKNRVQLPGIAVQRTDTDVTYALDWYTTDPTVITNAEEKEASYDKMGNCIGEHVDTMSDTIADDVLYKWCPTLTANILRTTGTADNVALAPSATGTRKAFMAKDLRRAQATMDKQKISKKDRYAIIPVDMLTQLLADPALTAIQVQAIMDVKEGVIPKLYGFNILTRSDTTLYDNTGTPIKKLPEAVGATTDNMTVLCWQKNAVAKAMGTTDFFENKQDALFYGDVYSAGQRCGGRIRRTAEEGVIAIVQIP